MIPAVQLPRTAQAYLLDEFHQAVTTGTTPATTCQDNLRSLGMVFDAVESFQTAQVVPSRTA